MTKTLSGKNILNNFLKEHAYRLSQISFRGSNLNYSPAEKHQGCEYFGRMVLHSAPLFSSQAWGSSGGARWDVGAGVPAGGRDTGKQGKLKQE